MDWEAMKLGRANWGVTYEVSEHAQADWGATELEWMFWGATKVSHWAGGLGTPERKVAGRGGRWRYGRTRGSSGLPVVTMLVETKEGEEDGICQVGPSNTC